MLSSFFVEVWGIVMLLVGCGPADGGMAGIEEGAVVGGELCDEGRAEVGEDGVEACLALGLASGLPSLALGGEEDLLTFVGSQGGEMDDEGA